MVGFGFAHSSIGPFLFFAALAMIVWLLVALVWMVRRAGKRIPIGRAPLAIAATTAAFLVLPFVPNLLLPVVFVLGPGPNAAELLSSAAATHDRVLVDLLLDRGVDVNSRFSDRATALSGASVAGDSAMVLHLFNRGARANIPGDSGSLALKSALNMKHAGIAAMLLKRGADPVCYAREREQLEATIKSRDSLMQTVFAHDDSVLRAMNVADSRLQDSLMRALDVKQQPCGPRPSN